MKVSRKVNIGLFKELLPGMMFVHNGYNLMKTEKIFSETANWFYNAVDLETGEMWSVHENEIVAKVNAHIEID